MRVGTAGKQWGRSLRRATARLLLVVGVGLAASTALRGAGADSPGLPPIRLSPDAGHFVSAGSGVEFKPWGVNYDHDAAGRLLEDYWRAEWPKVEKDFAGIKALGANTVRIHLQTGRFMSAPQEPNREALAQLTRLLRLAEKTRVYLDITGLGCYDRAAVPAWYNELKEAERWEVQARFWQAVARTCAASPAVFCYDLMNEPVVTEDPARKDWTPGEFGGKCFVQRLTLDLAGRTQEQIAKAWVDQLVAAVRKEDRQRLVTVGVIPWALTWPTAKPLFYSKEVGRNLDFASVHFYPKRGEVDEALTALAVYRVGKPLVIEEMFPLTCSVPEMDQFINGSKAVAQGWISFYWGKSAAEYRQDKADTNAALIGGWLEHFSKKSPEMVK